MYKINAILALCAALCTMSCSINQFPGIHKIEIEQGNRFTAEQVQRLELGMSKQTVANIMGGLPIVKSEFSAERWDYVHTIESDSKPYRVKHISLQFNDGRLSAIKRQD